VTHLNIIDLKRSMKPLKGGKGRRGAEIRTKPPLSLKRLEFCPLVFQEAEKIMSCAPWAFFTAHIPLLIFIMGLGFESFVMPTCPVNKPSN